MAIAKLRELNGNSYQISSHKYDFENNSLIKRLLVSTVGNFWSDDKKAGLVHRACPVVYYEIWY